MSGMSSGPVSSRYVPFLPMVDLNIWSDGAIWRTEKIYEEDTEGEGGRERSASCNSNPISVMCLPVMQSLKLALPRGALCAPHLVHI